MSRQNNKDMQIKFYQESEAHKTAYYLRSQMNKLIGRTEYIKHAFLTSNTPSAGSESQAFIGKQGDRFMETLTLAVRISSMSQTGGAFVRLLNGWLPYLFDYIRIYDNGNEIVDYNPHQIYEKLLLETGSDYKDNFILKKNIGIDTDANRATKAASSQTYYLDFSKFCDIFKRPFPMFKLKSNELEFRIKLNSNFSNLIQSDGTITPFTIEDMAFYGEWVDPGQKVINMVKNMNDFPLYHLRPTTVYHQEASGSSAFEHNLTQLANKSVAFITFKGITETNATTSKSYTTWTTIDEHELLSSGNQLHNANFAISDDLFKKVLISDYNPKNWSVIHDANLYFISYTNDLAQELSNDHLAESGLSHIGSYYFTQTDVQIRRKQNSNLGAAERLYITIWQYQPLVIRDQTLKVL